MVENVIEFSKLANRDKIPENYYKILYLKVQNGLPVVIPFHIEDPTILQLPLKMETPFQTALHKKWLRSTELDPVFTPRYETPPEFVNCRSDWYLAELHDPPYTEQLITLTNALQIRIHTTAHNFLLESNSQLVKFSYNVSDNWSRVRYCFRTIYESYEPHEDPEDQDLEEGEVGETIIYEFDVTETVDTWIAWGDPPDIEGHMPQQLKDAYDRHPEWSFPRQDYSIIRETEEVWIEWQQEWHTSYGFEYHFSWWLETCDKDGDGIEYQHDYADGYGEVSYDTLETIDDFYTESKPNETAVGPIMEESQPNWYRLGYPIYYNMISLQIKEYRIEKYIDYYEVYLKYGEGKPTFESDRTNAIEARNKFDERAYCIHFTLNLSGVITIVEKGPTPQVVFPQEENDQVILDTVLNINRIPARNTPSQYIEAYLTDNGRTELERLKNEALADWVADGRSLQFVNTASYNLLNRRIVEG